MVVVLTLLFGFLVGALTIIVVEVGALVLLIRHLNRRVQKKKEEEEEEAQSAPGISQFDDSFLTSSYYNKEVRSIHLSSFVLSFLLPFAYL